MEQAYIFPTFLEQLVFNLIHHIANSLVDIFIFTLFVYEQVHCFYFFLGIPVIFRALNFNLAPTISVELVHIKSMVGLDSSLLKWGTDGLVLTRCSLLNIDDEPPRLYHSAAFSLAPSNYSSETLWSILLEGEHLTQMKYKFSTIFEGAVSSVFFSNPPFLSSPVLPYLNRNNRSNFTKCFSKAPLSSPRTMRSLTSLASFSKNSYLKISADDNVLYSAFAQKSFCSFCSQSFQSWNVVQTYSCPLFTSSNHVSHVQSSPIFILNATS